MSKWIVFITVVHEEISLSGDLRSERSEGTYPLLAVPTNAIAELVVARLNHQHGAPEETGTDYWQEFSFKAESDLTPQEVAMALDLNDPAYPKNGRLPSWLSEMVAAAKSALADVAQREAGLPTTKPSQASDAHHLSRLDRIESLLGPLVAADSKVMALGARLRLLEMRGAAASTYAQTVQVQAQLSKWIDPILKDLNDAEAASGGIGSLLAGFINEPSIWEVETRLAIRDLKGLLAAFILSNGSELEHSLIVGLASGLATRGKRLQAVREAVLAEAAHTSRSGSSVEAPVGGSAQLPSGAPKDDTVRDIGSTPLTGDHEAILAVLGKTPTKCRTVIDVASAGTIHNRETVGRLLRELAKMGFVDRPHGKRKGYGLTPAGVARLSKPPR